MHSLISISIKYFAAAITVVCRIQYGIQIRNTKKNMAFPVIYFEFSYDKWTLLEFEIFLDQF